jgi:hypothetical protein
VLLGSGNLGWILSIVELGVFIVAGCLATMRVLLSIDMSPKYVNLKRRLSAVGTGQANSGNNTVTNFPDLIVKEVPQHHEQELGK